MLYTFLGDDFTGSTDVLEQLASAGIEAVLFAGPPSPADIVRFPGVQAAGIAGDSRSRSPAWMSAHLPALFAALRHFAAPVLHYKTCSTFDSSPTTGSIGRAIEIGRAGSEQGSLTPILVGAPHLRRFVAFGQLFAAAPDGQILRIDRHPMAHHPVTPMREADLRRHLALQTSLPIGLVDLTRLTSESLTHERALGREIILFDTIDEPTLSAAGELIWAEATRQPLFAAGSSGLTAALITAWRTRALIPAAPPPSHPGIAEPLLVLSGSCSPATERQIHWAAAHGFRSVPVDAAALLDPSTAATTIEHLRNRTLASLTSQHSTILYTALGTPAGEAHGDRLGLALGNLLRDLLNVFPLRRVLLCGGDTSSHAVQPLGLTALTWMASLQPGAPLCCAHRALGEPPLELVLKGGQVGTEDFFDVVRRGG